MTKEQFENKYVGKAVHCDTEEKAKELLAIAHEFGWTWRRNSLLDKTCWEYYKSNTCYELRIGGKTYFDQIGYYKKECWEVVEFESEENKVKKTKKVFDLGLFVKWNIENGRSYVATVEDIDLWAWNYHGKTQEEMEKNGKHVTDEWMKEVEVEHELSEKEIEILKALKVLDFKWIARDENNYLYAYELKPFKMNSFYHVPHNTRLNSTLFPFISWEDEEPTSIDELLKEC